MHFSNQAFGLGKTPTIPNMKHLIIALLVACSFDCFSQSIGINNTGQLPDSCAILDITSNSKGVLIPRMDSTTRINILNPKEGLLVYDSSYHSFWYYKTSWIQLSSTRYIKDTDEDTKIMVEKSNDEDTIYHIINAVEFAKMDGKTLHMGAPDESVYIGRNSGLYTKGLSNYSTAVGYETLKHDSIGWGNSAVGYQALSAGFAGKKNTALGYQALENTNDGSQNTALGFEAMQSNSSGNNNIAIGPLALHSNQAGHANVAIGSHAAAHNTVDGIVAIGDSSLYANSTGITKSGQAEKNTAVGYHSLKNNTIGFSNTALGYSSLAHNNSGAGNVSIGSLALTQNTSGNGNTAVGNNTLLENTIGNANTAVGRYVLESNTTGVNNSGIGYSSLSENTTGHNNTSAGYQSMKNNQTGSKNVSLGYRSLYSNTLASNNVALGTNALYRNTIKSGIVAVGDSSLYNNGHTMNAPTQSEENTAVGSKTLFNNDGGSKNTAMGFKTLFANTTGHRNSGMGGLALNNNSTGFHNIAVGHRAGFHNTSGSQNTYLGTNAGFENEEGNFNTFIGFEAGRLGSESNISGSVFIGNSAGYFETESNKLYVANSTTTTPLLYGEFDTPLLQVNGSLNVNDAYTLPIIDGNAEQVLTTDGSGTISWQNSVSTPWNSNASDLYYNTGKIGIGTNSPDDQLDVKSLGSGMSVNALSLGAGSIHGLDLIAGRAVISNAQDSIIGIDAKVGHNDGISIAVNAKTNDDNHYAGVFDGNVIFKNSNSNDNEVKLFPSASGNNGNTSLFLGEDNDGTYGMGIKYIGDINTLTIFRRQNGTETTYFRYNADGQMALGDTFASGHKLSVDGKVACEEVLVDLDGNWPDYVFEDSYDLMTWQDLEQFIISEKHLPNIPSATHVEEHGMEIGEMQKLMMEKIEELTLHVIRLSKENEELKTNIKQLSK